MITSRTNWIAFCPASVVSPPRLSGGLSLQGGFHCNFWHRPEPPRFPGHCAGEISQGFSLPVQGTRFGADREAIRLALEAENTEARPVWKPIHRQPIFADCEAIGGAVAEEFFNNGLCLPSGSNLSATDLLHVVEVIRWVQQR